MKFHVSRLFFPHFFLKIYIFIWAQNKSVLERVKMSQLFTLILTVTYIVVKLINHNAVKHIELIFWTQ